MRCSFLLPTQMPHLAKLWLFAACVALCFGPGAQAIKCQVCRFNPERDIQCWPWRTSCTIDNGYCLHVITFDAKTRAIKYIRRNCIRRSTKLCKRKFVSEDETEIHGFACCDEKGCLMPKGLNY